MRRWGLFPPSNFICSRCSFLSSACEEVLDFSAKQNLYFRCSTPSQKLSAASHFVLHIASLVSLFPEETWSILSFFSTWLSPRLPSACTCAPTWQLPVLATPTDWISFHEYLLENLLVPIPLHSIFLSMGICIRVEWEVGKFSCCLIVSIFSWSSEWG